MLAVLIMVLLAAVTPILYFGSPGMAIFPPVLMCYLVGEVR